MSLQNLDPRWDNQTLEHIQKVFEFVNENTAPNKTLGYDK